MQIPFIDLKSQYLALKESIDQRVHAVLSHAQFIMGPEVAACEKELAKFTGAKHALTVSNGTDALQLALMAAGVGPGDEVITSPFSFIATAETICLVGATPVFVDIDPETYNLNPSLLDAAITDKTKAIMPVSLYGQPADMDEIMALARQKRITVIEDAAQSFGATYKGKRSCNLSDIGCTSFFPAKPLGCYGDGGAVFTNDDHWAALLTSLRVHGMGDHRYHHPRVGMNGRLDTLQCAVLLAKLERYPWEIEQRDRIAANYSREFESLSRAGVRTPKVRKDRTSVWAQYTLWVPDRIQFQKYLQDNGVPTAVHYPIAMADQPGYKDKSRAKSIANARAAAEHVVSLPMYPDMPGEIQNRIIDVVKKAFA